MKPLVIDVEGDSEGHVFNYKHKMYLLGLRDDKNTWQFPIEWDDKPYGLRIIEAQKIIDDHDLVIAFNLKHDLLWCRRYGLKITQKLWCCQYAEYCISGQSWRLPDLDTAAQRRGLPGKLPWNWDISFNRQPMAEGLAYNGRDLDIELGLFYKQVEYLKDKEQLKRLIWNGSQDLGVTAEMEWNGLKYDTKRSLAEGHRLLLSIEDRRAKLRTLITAPQVNFESPKHVSAILYGGEISYDEREPYEFHYAHNRKPPVTKYRKLRKSLSFPRLVEPLNGTANNNGFSTEEGILLRLKATGLAKDIIDTLLEIRGWNKLVDTYYHGIPKLALEMGWESDVIHGQLHHCVTATGRLSSSKPNQQNLEHGVRECLVTRYAVEG